MVDDGKKTENLCFKCTERMALDILRLAAAKDMKLSAFIYQTMRQKLYGDIVGLDRTNKPDDKG